eukprot:243206-Amphidinium_carterae.1
MCIRDSIKGGLEEILGFVLLTIFAVITALFYARMKLKSALLLLGTQRYAPNPTRRIPLVKTEKDTYHDRYQQSKHLLRIRFEFLFKQ